MKYYLSSYRFGNEVDKLQSILTQGARIGHINNAKDWIEASPERQENQLHVEMTFLDDLGYENEHLDLKKYFGYKENLRQKLNTLDGVWVAGGNTFVLRQAMRLSGFDELFEEVKSRKDFFWGGYSAGVCILCDSLKYISEVDDPNDFPYRDINTPIYEGLGVFDYGILPHYDSDHHESDAIGLEVERCQKNNWKFKTMRDGDVWIFED